MLCRQILLVIEIAGGAVDHVFNVCCCLRNCENGFLDDLQLKYKEDLKTDQRRL